MTPASMHPSSYNALRILTRDPFSLLNFLQYSLKSASTLVCSCTNVAFPRGESCTMLKLRSVTAGVIAELGVV